MFKKLASIALLAILSISQVACSSSTIAALASTLGNAGASIAVLENNPTLATQLRADTTAAVTAINSWKAGTPAQDVIQALNIVEADLNLIPGTSQYTPLVDLAIGTVESILALLPQTQGVTANARMAGEHRNVRLTNAPKTAKQFKQQWNDTIGTYPALGAARIK